MNLEKVYEILDKHAEKVDYDVVEDRTNGNSFEELCVRESHLKWYPEKGLTQTDIDRVVHIETQGGEDCGSYYHVIIKVRDDESGEEAYVCWVGHYDSWNGTDWYNDPEIVTPVKKMVEVTEWHTVK